MVNEGFGEQYTGEERILASPSEHFLNRQDGEVQERITDSSFTIMGEVPKKYHIECQSTPDGSMMIRMFEYDSQIALDDAQIGGYKMTVTFPRSAVLFLRHNSRTPDRMEVAIRTEAGEISHNIRVIKLQDYSLDEIFRKKLLLFIPFYIFSYEKALGEMEEDAEKMEAVAEEYYRIRAYLDGMCAKGQLTEYEKRTIIDMSKKVLDSIASKYARVREGVSDAMGGKVLDYEAKDILRRGIAQGLEQGIEQGARLKLVEQVCRKIAKGKDVDRIAEELEEAKETVQEIYLIAEKYAPDYDVDKILTDLGKNI